MPAGEDCANPSFTFRIALPALALCRSLRACPKRGGNKRRRATFPTAENSLAGSLPEQVVKPAQLSQSELMQRGSECASRELLEESADLFREVIKREPTNAAAHNNLAVVLKRQGLLDQALSEYKAAQKYGEDSALTKLRIARTLKDAGQHRDSLVVVAEVLAKEPKETEALIIQALNYWKLGQLAKASASLEQALDIDPAFVQARNNLGGVLYDSRKYEDAVKVWRQALSIKPDYAEVHYNMGTALYQAGLYQPAADALQECLKLTPMDAMAHNNLGLALLKLGKTAEAVSQWRKAIEIEPDLAQAHINLGKALMQDNQRPLLGIHESG